MTLPAVYQRFDLTGRVALVTGASSGIGRHFARTLAAAGAQVAIAARRTEKLAPLAGEIEAAGGRVFSVAMDVTNRDSIHQAFLAAIAALGTPTIVVNNAGIAMTKPALQFSDAEWADIIGTNLSGAWAVAQEAARYMVAAKTAGTLINVTSILASRTAGGVSPYSTAKAGLKHLTQSLALELARFDIRVNSIAPGYIVTEMNEALLASDAGEKLKSRIPTRRFGTYADLDGPLLLLAADASAHMTGSEIVVDGGHLCSSL